MRLSEKAGRIAESKTVQFTPLLQRLKSQGKSVIDLAVGEPEYDTPASVINAVKHALDGGNTRYGPVAGLPLLRELLAEPFPGWDAGNIIVSNGSKQALFLFFQVILNPEDEVIIPRPYWVSFSEQVKMAGGRPVFADTPDHQLDAAAVSRVMTKNTRAVIINSPNNPTGAVYREAEIEAVLFLAAENNMFVVSDEAYGQFVYDRLDPKMPFDMTADRSRLIIIRSFSKHFNMTGFRVGYTAADKEIIRAMTAYQSHCSGNVCTFAQHGALAALDMDVDLIRARKNELEQKRNRVFEGISRRFDCIRPSGAFYVFPSVKKFLSPNETSLDFAGDLLEKTGVAVVPGEAFGSPGHIRISYAVSEKLLVEGIKRINEYVDKKC
jgi:aspartate aminotransferase